MPPSPLQELHDPLFAEHELRVWLKRDDLYAPVPGDPYCGNKCRKLRYNLRAARAQGQDHLLSCGGAYSNHIAALASAGRRYGFRTTGIIRGEPVDNPTLRRALAEGMHLHFVSRTVYRQRQEPEQIAAWQRELGAGYWLPEGGTNERALRGCGELYDEISEQLGAPPDYTLVACGTGGTLAGMIRAAAGRGRLIGVSALKGDFLTAEVARLIVVPGEEAPTNWTLETGYHHGGYARVPDALYAFLRDFLRRHDVLPDPVYTAKLFYAAYALVRAGYFPPGSRVVWVHSGGLQGWGGKVGSLVL